MHDPTTYNNLIDCIIEIQEDPHFCNSEKAFTKLLSDYFFSKETSENKAIAALISQIPVPDSIKQKDLLHLTTEDIAPLVCSENLHETISARIMLHPTYIKHIYPQHTPSFSKLPPEIKSELIILIKERNQLILKAFEKLQEDILATKTQTMKTIIALILKNVYLKSGFPFCKTTEPVSRIIDNTFYLSNQKFGASNSQINELMDDTKIKKLLKSLFVIRRYEDLAELTQIYKAEAQRFIKRAQKLLS